MLSEEKRKESERGKTSNLVAFRRGVEQKAIKLQGRRRGFHSIRFDFSAIFPMCPTCGSGCECECAERIWTNADVPALVRYSLIFSETLILACSEGDHLLNCIYRTTITGLINYVIESLILDRDLPICVCFAY
jgi:hypothetical protein